MRNRAIIAIIVILSIMGILLTGVFVYLLSNGGSLNFGNTKLDLIDSYSVLPDNIENINIQLYSTDVEIKESADDSILVEYYSNRKEEVKIQHTEKEIIVNEEKFNTSCKGFCFLRRKVVLYVPASYTGEFTILTRSGDVESFIKAPTNKAIIKTSSGDVEVDTFAILKVTTSSGDVEIDKVTKQLDVETSSGDVDINTLSITKNSTIITSSGDVDINKNTNHCYIETSTRSGDTKIKNIDRKSDIELKIKTSSGDISAA